MIRLAGVALMLALLAACGPERPRGPLDYTRDENFAIDDPGGRQATATGTGCGYTQNEAIFEARRTANYNLRGVMGAGRYRVDYETMRQYREASRYCADVLARVNY
jgi:hypothetical protein